MAAIALSLAFFAQVLTFLDVALPSFLGVARTTRESARTTLPTPTKLLQLHMMLCLLKSPLHTACTCIVTTTPLSSPHCCPNTLAHTAQLVAVEGFVAAATPRPGSRQHYSIVGAGRSPVYGGWHRARYRPWTSQGNPLHRRGLLL